MEWQQSGAGGAAVTRQPGFNLGGLSVDNWMRVQSQNERKISVIIGNPPYNDSQQNANDLNPNRKYPAIDKRIRETYVQQSSARKSHQYDMYKRFIRWASDRLADDGIIAFVTNRSYLDKYQEDGFRRQIAQEFSGLYVLDLGSDVRRNPNISGTTHNVFGIQTGVAIGFFVRNKSINDGGFAIHYASREDSERANDTLRHLRSAKIADIPFENISPDEKAYWLNQSQTDFGALLPIASRETKVARSQAEESAVFGLSAPGVKSNRDEWVYDIDPRQLTSKISFFAGTYNALVASGHRQPDLTIKWSPTLANHLRASRSIDLSESTPVVSAYRPFVVKHYFPAPEMSDRLTASHFGIFGENLTSENRIICFQGVASSGAFRALATDCLPDFHLTGDSQCLPLYRYREDGTRVSNITAWGLRQFRDHFGDQSITAEQIFAYTYAALHDPIYREKYAIDLTRDFPRLPFHDDFPAWVDLGQELLDLHIEFESAEPYALKRVDKALIGRRAGNAPKALLRADKERAIINLDERTSLEGVPPEVWDYRLGNRSALEWILDQYKEKTPKDPTIREHFNTYKFADHKEKVIDLLCRVTIVSLRTNEIIASLAKVSSVKDAVTS